MFNFDFYNPTRIVFGKDRLEMLNALVPSTAKVFGSEEERIDLAIQKTRSFFESLGVKTRLSEYGISADQIPMIVEKLKTHGMTAMSETKDLTLGVSRRILETAL